MPDPASMEDYVKQFDQSYGSPFDRGSADSYYHRPPNPHFYPNGTNAPPRIGLALMSSEDIRAYYAGYDYNEELGHKKELG